MLTWKERFSGRGSRRCLMILCLSMVTPLHALATSEGIFSEVAEGVFVHLGRHEEMSTANHGDIANSVFVIGTEGVAVIDPGGSVFSGHLLVAAIKAHTDLPVRWVILSHFHPDHVAAVSVFPADVQVFAHARYPQALAQRGGFYRERYTALFAEDSDTALRLPDSLVADTLTLDLGNRQLVMTAHPTGHTDNDLSVFDSSSMTLFASDLVFAQRTPSLDGNLRGWLDVLATLEQQEYSLVVPGHGIPGRWSELVQPQRAYLNRLLSDVGAQIEQGDTLTEAINAGVRQTNTQGWLLYEEVHPGNVTKAYTELEWE